MLRYGFRIMHWRKRNKQGHALLKKNLHSFVIDFADRLCFYFKWLIDGFKCLLGDIRCF
jgi:hypothetical protein